MWTRPESRLFSNGPIRLLSSSDNRKNVLLERYRDREAKQVNRFVESRSTGVVRQLTRTKELYRAEREKDITRI
jgi:hypothetical protein